ncbi:MAG TPA: pectate lyase [Verrucomicrobiales bacterium]|nr:pectate lyase [Verrucomicrobiales bacterium]HIL69103.1 pectate lyase [Verrucomicrobiota bacterium]
MNCFFQKQWRLTILLMVCGLFTMTVIISAKNASREDLQLAENMLLYQRYTGGWPKNYNDRLVMTDAARKNLMLEKNQEDSTFDNGATHSEMEHLAETYTSTGDPRFKDAFFRGLRFMLAAQYENGGWPQTYPNPSGYHAHITFNDDAMIGVLRLLKTVARGEKPYAFVDRVQRNSCLQAVQKGVKCILQCQIKVDGRLTAWCAQHDSRTFAPKKARSYELPSLSGSESVSIVRFLMEIDKPSPAVIDSIQGAVTWFDNAKLTGIKLIKEKDESSPKGWNKIVIKDSTASPLWARFYEIGSNKPIFCSRDGVPKETLTEISYERRNGYSWLGNRASSLLAVDYPVWQSKQAPDNNVLKKAR